jgi:hypothetical protein
MPRGIRNVVAGGVTLAVCFRSSRDWWRHFLNGATGGMDNRGDCKVGMSKLHDGALALIAGRSSSHVPRDSSMAADTSRRRRCGASGSSLIGEADFAYGTGVPVTGVAATGVPARGGTMLNWTMSSIR